MNNFAPTTVPASSNERRSYTPPAFVQELVLETRAGTPAPNFQDGHNGIMDPILGLPPTPQP